ncbi:L-threonylcarbamoyladenylate synthase [Ornithinimicrobium pekingense]|uniref:Threonylcarbamoyl-AMP synthase n=1 Tax=Ornithinimicrobium pekingense TaxID=384677 RepID=A0ABQ2FD50_9MICO|nr:L-threonylcarbamoyladenylate synthase [Ornithinimicrobium pekingense]GGK76000.1 threonylcarbamoyl-AMP synthase [Ornithinimicrobium pekingense]
MARFVDIHPVDPQPRLVAQVADVLREGGLAAFPTDACYTLGARLSDAGAKQRIIDIRRLDDKHHFTLMCADFAQLGQLVQLDNSVFRAVRAATPGAYTFILPATGEVPRRLLHPRKRTVGVRLPDHRVCQALLAEVGEPLLTSTLLLPGAEEPLAFGWEVKEALDHLVDVVVEGDQTGQEPTTVVDFSEGYPEVVRVGSGDPEPFR